MKILKRILVLFVLFFSYSINAQTVDEIIDTYFENTGGVENWEKIEGIKMSAKVSQGGMEIPIEMVQLKNKMMTTINFVNITRRMKNAEHLVVSLLFVQI